ncbi:MAG: hypothetical protein ACRDGM_01750, partial [bacterium]
MRKALYPAVLFVGLLGALLGVNLAWSLEFDVAPASPDSRSMFLRFVFCYDVRTWAELNCRMSYKILGLEPPAQIPCDPQVKTCIEETLVNTGGHNHNESHPLIDSRQDAGVQLLKNGIVFTGTLEREITFQTDNDVIVVLHNVPQVSGRIGIQTSTLQFPPRYQCAFPGACDFRDTVNVEVSDLVPLPAEGPFHKTVRTPESVMPHPGGTFGTSRTVRLLGVLANNYCKALVDIEADVTSCQNARSRLSINDLSLPKGGMFDLNRQWFVNKQKGNGHLEHRTGTDADINREDAGGVFTTCEDDQELHE